MTAFIVCVIAVLNPLDCPPPPLPPVPVNGWEGWLSGYADGVMAGVVDLRQAWGHLPSDDHIGDVDGYAATLWCDLIGDVVALRHYDGDTVRERRVLVADCAGAEWPTVLWMTRTPYALEVDYALWAELGPGWVWAWRSD